MFIAISKKNIHVGKIQVADNWWQKFAKLTSYLTAENPLWEFPRKYFLLFIICHFQSFGMDLYHSKKWEKMQHDYYSWDCYLLLQHLISCTIFFEDTYSNWLVKNQMILEVLFNTHLAICLYITRSARWAQSKLVVIMMEKAGENNCKTGRKMSGERMLFAIFISITVTIML